MRQAFRHAPRDRPHEMNLRTLALVCIAVSLAAISIDAVAVDPVAVFSPQGTVKPIRQVTARFSVPMVALGDPRLADPFEIDCAAKGHGRWADERNWVYDFDADLRAGVRCTFKLRAGLRNPRRRACRRARASSSSTPADPAIRASLPWRRCNGAMRIRCSCSRSMRKQRRHRSNAPPTARSTESANACRSRTRPVTNAHALLEQRRELGYSYYQILWKDGAMSTARVRDRSLEEAEAQLAVLACKRALPADAKMQLVWGAGIEAPSGIATTLDQKLAFQVRPAFTARVQCERVNARAGCIPLQPIRLQFSAPVPSGVGPARPARRPLTGTRWRRSRLQAEWRSSKS